MIRSPLWLAAALLWPGTSPVWAQVDAPEALAPTAAGPAVLPRELGKPDEELKLDITAYQVDGLPEASPEALAAITAPYIGKGRGHEDMVNAATAVTRYIQRDLGYYVGFAYVPEQARAGGVIHLQAVEGRLDEVVVNAPEGDARLPKVVNAQLASLKPGSILRAAELERAALLLNDLRGWRFKVEITEGRTLGTASIKVTPSPERTVSGRIEADTLGNRDSGLVRLSGTVVWDNPLQRGDVLSAQLLTSHTSGLNQASLAYTTPLGPQGLKVGVTASHVDYALDRDAFVLDLHGRVDVAGAFALYPVVRSRNLNVFGLLSFEHKHFEDSIASLVTHKTTKDWVLGLIADSRDAFGGGGINTYGFEVLQGRLDANGFVPLDHSFSRVTLGYSRLQTLLPERLQAYVRYKGQLSGTRLDVTERYAAGGPLGVRAYAPGEAAADTAHVINTELRWLPPEAWLGPLAREVVVSAFYDWAHVKFVHDNSVGVPSLSPNTTSLSGGGFGVVWDRPEVASVRLDLAWRGTGADVVGDRRDHSPRANLVLSKRF